jgi:hypothetical protein
VALLVAGLAPFGTGAGSSAPRFTPSLSLRPTQILETSGVIEKLSADAGRVALEAPGNGGCGPIGIWTPARGLAWIQGSSCPSGMGLPEDHDQLVLAGGYAAWTKIVSGIPDLEALETGNPASGSTRIATADGGTTSSDEEVAVRHDVGQLAGDGPLLVYTSWTATYGPGGIGPAVVSDGKLWRIVAGREVALVTAGADAMDGVAADARRIVVLRRGGTLAILAPNGRRLGAFGLGEVRAVKLAGPRLVALRDRKIEVRSAASGDVIHVWPTARTSAGVALQDAQANFAVYTAGIAIHLLRLSDGRDRALAIAGERGPVDADLEPEGVYYSYTKARSAKPGRVAFVPWQQLKQRFD